MVLFGCCALCTKIGSAIHVLQSRKSTASYSTHSRQCMKPQKSRIFFRLHADRGAGSCHKQSPWPAESNLGALHELSARGSTVLTPGRVSLASSIQMAMFLLDDQNYGFSSWSWFARKSKQSLCVCSCVSRGAWHK